MDKLYKLSIMGKFKDMTDGLKMLKDLQKSMGGMDLNDPQKLLDSMNLDMDKLNESFMEQMTPKTVLRYSLKSVNKEPEIFLSHRFRF